MLCWVLVFTPTPEALLPIPAGTLVMHQRVYAADEEQIVSVREGYRLYQLIPPRKRHHRLSMEEQVKKAGTAQE